ncbi:MAG TPA: DUF362 domain-containing protein, partial [Candidatus Polarisedimenticolia bacterium]|nr:DUF362 domain-containing protein [Candidatus Polarisedimenticolia bacterium]
GALARAFSLVGALRPASLPPLVVIKPNLCDIVPWEAGVTTDPRWLGVLAGAMRAVRPDVDIKVVESDAIGAYRGHRSCDETYERLGYVSAAGDCGVELVNLSREESLEVVLEGIPFPVRIPSLLLREMYVISIANLKVHPYERMTGTLKNNLGLLPDADISPLHPFLARLIRGLHMLCPADLCIIDGRIGLEGKGPILGDPVRCDTLIVGNDALATDETACRFMGIEPDDVPHLRETARALNREFGRYELAGECRPRCFAFDPEGAHPSILAKFASRRAHARLERLSNRWIDRVMRLRRDPVGFTRGVVSRFGAGRRER